MLDYLETDLQDGGGFDSVLKSMKAKYAGAAPRVPRAEPPEGSAFDTLHGDFQNKFGVPLEDTGFDTPIHRRLYGDGQARDFRSRTLTPDQRGYVVSRAGELGLIAHDYTDNWRQIGGTGPHIHINYPRPQDGAARNGFDDVLDSMKSKYEPEQAAPTAGGFDSVLSDMRSKYDDKPKAIWGQNAPVTPENIQAQIDELRTNQHVKPEPQQRPLEAGVDMRLTADQDANTPVAPDLSGDKIASMPAESIAHSTVLARPLYLGDLADRIKRGKVDVKELTDEINRRVTGDLADRYNLSAEEVRQYTPGYKPEEVQAALEGIRADLADAKMNGHTVYHLPGDYDRQLGALSGRVAHQKELQRLASLPDDQKEQVTREYARKGPIPDDVRQALNVQTSLPRTFIAGVGKSVGETVSGVGRMDRYIPGMEWQLGGGLLQDAGKDIQDEAQIDLNTYKPEGVIGEAAQSTGEVLPDVAGAVLAPESIPAQIAYWGTSGATKELGRGGTPMQAAQSGLINAGMVGAVAPLRHVAGVVGDSLGQTSAKTATRAGLGLAMGYGMARGQGAPSDKAFGQAIPFGVMAAHGGRGGADEGVTVRPGAPVEVRQGMRTGAGEGPVMPETSATVAEQMKAMQEGRRKAVITTLGTAVPEGFTATETPKGTVIHNPDVISHEEVHAKVVDGTHGELLGHVEPKGENTRAFVIARNPETGVEQQISYVSPERVNEQIAEFQRQFPGTHIEVGGADTENQVLNERAAQIGEESQHHSNYQPRDEGGRFNDPVRAAADSEPADNEPDFVRAARERLRAAIKGQESGNLSANPLQHFKDAAIITGYDVFKGTMDFADWSREMVLRLGNRVKPHLDEVWDYLTTGKFGVADVRRRLEQTRLVPAKLIEEALSGERPEHINQIVDFLGEQRQKIREGALTPSDVARAYFMTVASQGTDAIKVDTLKAKLAAAGVDMDIPDDFAIRNKKGEAMIRPEDAAGAWLLSEKGQQALADLENGKFNEAAWREGAKVRAAFGDDRVGKNNVLGQAPKGAFNLRNLGDLLPALNDAKGDPAKIADLVSKLNGVGSGKTPFLKHLLGFGDSPTVDAVEINTWLTGRGTTRGAAGRDVELARAVKDFTGNAPLSNEIARRITNRFNEMRRNGVVGSDLSADDFGHVVHHWLWDKMKGTVNPQKGMYDAMRSEPDFVAQSRARLQQALSGSKLSANPIGALYDAAVVTGWELYDKARGFADWSRQMIDRHGPEVRQYLDDIWGRLEAESNRAFNARYGTESERGNRQAAPEQAAPPSSSIPPPDESVMDAPGKNGKTSPLSTLDSYIRANILSGPSPITHKLGSLTASAIADEVARPFAAGIDAARNAITGGGRSLYENTAGMARAFAAAVTKGVPEMGQILRRGFTPDQVARGDLPREVQGRPVIGDYINYVFRGYKAAVHPFEVYAYTRAMENQARVLAESEAKSGQISRGDVSARIAEIRDGQNVDPATAGQMEMNANLAAADATFRRDNPVSRKWSVVRKAVGPNWAFAMNRAVEFTRTPVNALIKTIELTPGLGQGKELIADLRAKLRTGEWLPDGADKQRFAMAWGKLPVGVGLFMLGSYLHRHGMMTGIIDNRKQKGMDYAEGKTPGSLQIAPNTWLDVIRYSAPGVVMSMGATWDYYRNGQGEDGGSIKDVMSDLYHTIAPAAESLPFMQNPSRILDPKAQMAKLLPGYSTVRDAYRGNQSTIGSAVPPARWLFGQSGPDVLGRKPQDQGFLNTVLHIRNGQPSAALDEMRANGVDYSRPWRRPGESAKDYNTRVARQGESMERRIADLQAMPTYQKPPEDIDAPEFRKKALEITKTTAAEDAEKWRKPREGDASIILYNAEVALRTKEMLSEMRKSESYRRLDEGARRRFDQAVEQRMQGAHASVSGVGSPGARISSAASRLRDLMSNRGALVREAMRQAQQ